VFQSHCRSAFAFIPAARTLAVNWLEKIAKFQVSQDESEGFHELFQPEKAFPSAVFPTNIGFMLPILIAYVLYYYVIEKLGAVRASALTYVPPVVALFLGAVFLGEKIGMIDYLATIVIFAGVVLVSKSPKQQK